MSLYTVASMLSVIFTERFIIIGLKVQNHSEPIGRTAMVVEQFVFLVIICTEDYLVPILIMKCCKSGPSF